MPRLSASPSIRVDLARRNISVCLGRLTSDPSMETRQSRAAAIHLGVCDRQLVGKGGANSKDWQGVAGIEIFRGC